MQNLSYYGVYRTRNATVTRALATTGQDKNHFPPSLSYEGVSYTLYQIYQASTPSQHKNFLEYCEKHNIETDVVI